MQPINLSNSSRHSKRRFSNVRRNSLLVLCFIIIAFIAGGNSMISRTKTYNYNNYTFDTVNEPVIPKEETISVIPTGKTLCSGISLEIAEYISSASTILNKGTLCSGISLEISECISSAYSNAKKMELLENEKQIVMAAPEEPNIEIPEWFLYSLAQLITAEGSILNDEAQQLIGYVFLNRMRSPYFPDTFDGVLNDSDAYHPDTHKFINNGNAPSEQALTNAKVCLENYYKDTLPVPDCLVYQAEFYQDAGAYREIGKMKYCLDSRPGYADNYQDYMK